jgi:carboxylesterase type B
MGTTQSSQQPCILETPLGSLKGIELSHLQTGKSVYRRFTRIPYALPPTGPLRWRRPQPSPTEFTFDSSAGGPGEYSQFGPISPQPVYGTGAAMVDNPMAAPAPQNVQSEDCLYLNVWVPAGEAPRSGWPVQFYIIRFTRHRSREQTTNPARRRLAPSRRRHAGEPV